MACVNEACLKIPMSSECRLFACFFEENFVPSVQQLPELHPPTNLAQTSFPGSCARDIGAGQLKLAHVSPAKRAAPPACGRSAWFVAETILSTVFVIWVQHLSALHPPTKLAHTSFPGSSSSDIGDGQLKLAHVAPAVAVRPGAGESGNKQQFASLQPPTESQVNRSA